MPLRLTSESAQSGSRRSLAFDPSANIKLDQDAWDLVERLTIEKALSIGEEIKSKQKRKVDILLLERRPKLSSQDKTRVVINLALTELSDDATDILAKGLNFTNFAPRNIPKEISALETTCRRLPQEVMKK